MHTEYLMGNAAIGMGAIAAGLGFISGYPGTPSSEVLETVAKHNDGSIYVEWSVNEKAALEAAAGAAYCGARAMVTMKQVGLNVASDPLMSLAYVGVKGGMVILIADDPGPISSQTEQDTRTFAKFSKLPCFDPTSPDEAFVMVREAFELSEKYHTPVILRPTTRICHGYASVNVPEKEDYIRISPEGFKKDSSKWVIFPRLSYNNHIEIEKRNLSLEAELSEHCRNEIKYADSELKTGFAAGGISYSLLMDELKDAEDKPKVLKIGTPFPFPSVLAEKFLNGLDRVICLEELDPVIERELLELCGKKHINVEICGKLSGYTKTAGENTPDYIREVVCTALNIENKSAEDFPPSPELPARPPVLCPGCPHRASFYAVKAAMKGKKTVYCGDIGCYTLGNAQPLDMVDTCLCMGAGVNMAQGIGRIEPDTYCFAFVGDSTFFASGITGAVNAVYNRANMTLVILDNSTTAMTGHQPHPGTGRTMMGDIAAGIDIEGVLRGVGVQTVVTLDPLDLKNSIEKVWETAALDGVKAIIFRSPCAMIVKAGKPVTVTDKCTGCKSCIRKLGCPGLIIEDGKVRVDPALCTGCGVCSQVCPVDAIKGGDDV